MRRKLAVAAAILVIGLLAAACVPIPAAPLAASTPGAAPANAAATFADPWAYCAAAQTIDAPDARYTGPAMPDALAAGLQRAITGKAETPSPAITGNSFWRCMGGKVYACTVGANLPCQSKANTSATPTEAMTGFCKEQPNADAIPMYITGHETIYEWLCKDGTPQVSKQIAEVDAGGFIKGIWYEIPPAQ